MVQLAPEGETGADGKLALTQADLARKKTKRKKTASEKLRLAGEKRRREDEIRARLAAFAEELERARANHSRLL